MKELVGFEVDGSKYFVVQTGKFFKAVKADGNEFTNLDEVNGEDDLDELYELFSELGDVTIHEFETRSELFEWLSTDVLEDEGFVKEYDDYLDADVYTLELDEFKYLVKIPKLNSNHVFFPNYEKGVRITINADSLDELIAIAESIGDVGLYD